MTSRWPHHTSSVKIVFLMTASSFSWKTLHRKRSHATRNPAMNRKTPTEAVLQNT